MFDAHLMRRILYFMLTFIAALDTSFIIRYCVAASRREMGGGRVKEITLNIRLWIIGTLPRPRYESGEKLTEHVFY